MLVLLVFTPRHSLNPKGIVLPATEKTFPAVSPDLVKIYKDIPDQDYQVVATIRAEQGFVPLKDKQSQEKLIDYVKTLAGSVGANGVIIRWFVPDQGVQKAFTFVGQAVRFSNVQPDAAVKE